MIPGNIKFTQPGQERETEYHIERIKCPMCAKKQQAKVEHTVPWYSYVHHCFSCGYIIMESEWEKVP